MQNNSINEVEAKNPLFSPVLKDRTYLKNKRNNNSPSKFAINQYKSDLDVNTKGSAIVSPLSENTENVLNVNDSSAIEMGSFQNQEILKPKELFKSGEGSIMKMHQIQETLTGNQLDNDPSLQSKTVTPELKD